MSATGFFVEIDVLQNKIKELEQKLQEEREEYRDIYARMKLENDILRKENIELRKNITSYINSSNIDIIE